MATSSPRTSLQLTAIKLAHTLIWAVFAGCILAIPVAAWHSSYRAAAWLVGVVAIEVVILALNNLRCPLTAVAARYTEDRRDNFDIFLPVWLARHNKVIFGTLYVVGTAFAVVSWSRT